MLSPMYGNFFDYLRSKYPKDMAGYTIIPFHVFRQELGRRGVRAEQVPQELTAMSFTGVVSRIGDFVYIAPDLKYRPFK